MKTVGEAIEKINDIQKLLNELERVAGLVTDEHMAELMSDASVFLEEYVMAIRIMPLKKEVPEF